MRWCEALFVIPFVHVSAVTILVSASLLKKNTFLWVFFHTFFDIFLVFSHLSSSFPLPTSA
jgi:MFS superfamily sulfate permease-like transporter